MSTKQLSILMENSANQLSRLIHCFSEEGVNIRAPGLVETGDWNCKLRIIVSEPDKAIEILQKKDIAAVINDVVVIETDDQPGALSRVLELFEAVLGKY